MLYRKMSFYLVARTKSGKADHPHLLADFTQALDYYCSTTQLVEVNVRHFWPPSTDIARFNLERFLGFICSFTGGYHLLSRKKEIV
jgi:hypothetical protein